MITNTTEMRTVPVGLAALQTQSGFTDIPQILAGAVMAIVPMLVIFLVFQRFVVAAIATSGLK